MQNLITSFINAKEGSIVRVNDIDLLIEHDDTAPKTVPDFLIKSKRIFENGQFKKVILTLDHIGSDIEYLLVGDIFEQLIDVSLYSHLSFFTNDKRSVLQRGDLHWLFDGDNYPHEIYNEDIVFTRKVNCEVFDNTAIIDWTTESKIVNYKLMLIETGIFNDGGGWVEFYEGRQLPETDITF